ncbi:SUKH-4 family immunity protein [Streptomyces sp. NPDC050145]|uniref:SUKH-4 family immunity protein n=1 Tax=Streptomyces sp. NPDC050145 TaxID=3365602 RepID=UPI00379F179E
MSLPLPPLPRPEFVLIPVAAPPRVLARIAAVLRDPGIPGGLIGYEYRPLNEPVYLGGIGERELVAIGTSGLSGHVAVDIATGHVVQIATTESATTHFVNRDLDAFSRCVAAVIACFPFYAEGDEERCYEVAARLRGLVRAVDEAALVPDGFWETFCDDVEMGDYADWDV